MSCSPPPPQHRSDNIVLTGFMGTGKTTVGRLVADRLGRPFLDTDDLIEGRHGPIPDIFEREGEPAFRAYEREVARELASEAGWVIATGGGLLLDQRNADALGATGRIFCLVADTGEIMRRVRQQAGTPEARPRPLLDGPRPDDRVAELLSARAAEYAHYEQVSTKGRTPDEIADDIVSRL